MDRNITVVTEQGQSSIPAAVRRELALEAGQQLHWEKISERECRVRVVVNAKPKGANAMLGFASKFRGDLGRPTAKWMKELREGDR